jgi:hypothetical protein
LQYILLHYSVIHTFFGDTDIYYSVVAFVGPFRNSLNNKNQHYFFSCFLQFLWYNCMSFFTVDCSCTWRKCNVIFCDCFTMFEVRRSPPSCRNLKLQFLLNFRGKNLKIHCAPCIRVGTKFKNGGKQFFHRVYVPQIINL